MRCSLKHKLNGALLVCKKRVCSTGWAEEEEEEEGEEKVEQERSLKVAGRTSAT